MMLKLGLIVDDGSGMKYGVKVGTTVVQINDGSGVMYDVKVGTDCCSD